MCRKLCALAHIHTCTHISAGLSFLHWRTTKPLSFSRTETHKWHDWEASPEERQAS